jgi:hypothetical protein
MDELKKKGAAEGEKDKEIVFSKAIKAGKRIYYLDVKRNRKDEMFLAITESKKVVSGDGDDSQVSFEKHKIFLYKEDFEKFLQGLNEVLSFINEGSPAKVKGASAVHAEAAEDAEIGIPDSEIKIDIDF